MLKNAKATSEILIFCIKRQNYNICAIILSYQYYDFNLLVEKFPTEIYLILKNHFVSFCTLAFLVGAGTLQPIKRRRRNRF